MNSDTEPEDQDDDEELTLEELMAIEASGGAIPHEEVMHRLGFE